jgi:transcriptional regulator with XRE-family HTH domain
MKRYDVKKSAARIQMLRASRGDTLAQAAASLDTDETTLGKVERGEIPGTVELFAKISLLYDVPLDFLIFEDAELPQQQEIDRLIDELPASDPQE